MQNAAESTGSNSGVDAGVIQDVQELNVSSGYGPMCSGWVARGAVPLPKEYTERGEGVELTARINAVKTVFGQAVPPASTSITLFNDLCALAAVPIFIPYMSIPESCKGKVMLLCLCKFDAQVLLSSSVLLDIRSSPSIPADRPPQLQG